MFEEKGYLESRITKSNILFRSQSVSNSEITKKVTLDNIPRFVEKFKDTSLDRSLPDAIYLDNGVILPEGMTIADLQDAFDQARKFVGQHISLVAFVRDRLERDGVMLGGHSLANGRMIELSVLSARLSATFPADLPGFEPAPAHHQLWATAFEEAMHTARKAVGKDQGPYFAVPANATEDDIQKYLTQETEKVVDDALNGGILRARVGGFATYYRKRVLVAPDVKNALSEMKKLLKSRVESSEFRYQDQDSRLALG